MTKKRDSQKVHKPRQTTVENKTIYVRQHLQHFEPIVPEAKGKKKGVYHGKEMD